MKSVQVNKRVIQGIEERNLTQKDCQSAKTCICVTDIIKSALLGMIDSDVNDSVMGSTVTGK